MNSNLIKSHAVVLALLLASLVGTPALADEESTPTYLLANLSVTDFDAYTQDYVNLLGPLLTEAGAEVFVVAPNVKKLEGDYGPNLTIVVKFPSAAAADAYFGSHKYSALRAARQANAETDASTLVLAPEFVAPTR